ncbi:MAG: GntR family transcriptional regulator [Acidimicrobiaceae bacterium]|nr:GntR family transcriptional regulator [Acidimicrobiaceae bacterium]
MRTIRYQQIADDLRERLGSVGVGQVLASESELSAEFGVSRVTIRRALEILREEGLVDARQGFGWYVAGEPLLQHLDALGTIEGQLERRGVRPERRVIEFDFRAAPARVAKVLGTDQVLRVKRLNLADDTPFAVVTVWCPAEMGHHLSRRDVESHPFYELLGVAARRDADDRCRLCRRCRRHLARGSRRQSGAALRAHHHRHTWPCGADERARVPRAAHGVRGRAAPGGALHRPQRPPVGGVAHRRCHVVGDRARAT